MAYKVQYTPQDDYRYPSVKRQVGRRRGRAGLLLLVGLLVVLILCNGLPDFLIPGDPHITKTAASEMVISMKSGTPVKDAVFVFCRQIIEGAGVS